MAEERKDSFAETVDTAASAAHTVKGAIKAGKAISGAAKGAAAGGPYGAVAGAVWAGRKHIGKIIAVIIILLLLPVLFILMLPGLIFGGLINAFSPADTEQPVLNSETAIVENANDITFTINSILGEALDDVIARIEADFASSGADQMEIKNPYSAGPVYNANLIVSQYCAARDEDFESISLDDLAAVLRENKEHLYSYTSVRESREVTSEDPETGEETTTTEIWMVYTIRYNGESYLADHVFALTDEQKELASDYASNLSMFLGDGLLQNLTEWTGNSIPSLGDVTFTDGVTPVVYFNQLDERYASQPYGTDNIGGYGCGPTAMSIVVSSLTDETVDPVAMAQWSYENGYWCKSSGSYHALIPAAAEAWGLPVSGCTTSEPQRILDALAEGKLVVAIMAEGHFTSSGHFIVLRGVKDGQIMVADPASYKRSEQLWDLSIILNEASRRAGAGGPFWIADHEYPASADPSLPHHEVEEEGGADEGGEDADGDLGGQQVPGHVVHRQEKDGAEEHGGGHEGAVVVAHQPPAQVGDHQPHPADHAGDRDGGGGDQGGAQGQNEAQPVGVDAHGLGLLVP